MISNLSIPPRSKTNHTLMCTQSQYPSYRYLSEETLGLWHMDNVK